jgi:hypothetical protein
MQELDAGTAIECINLADELYEVVHLTTMNNLYEVLQLTHDGLIQHMVVHYKFDQDLNLSGQRRMLANIEKADLFQAAADARVRVMELVMQANFNA